VLGTADSLDAYAVKCWGNNGSNALRFGSSITEIARPTELTGGNFRDVAVGNDFVCTLDDSSDDITCTGNNSNQQLGTAAAVDTYTFSHAGTVAISAVNYQGCLLTNAGKVRCWGDGFSDPGSVYNTRELDLGGAVAAEVSAGSILGCVRLTSGQVKCWGAVFAGDSWMPHTLLAEDALPLAGVVQVVTCGVGGAPAVHGCARLDTGRVACWGVNYFGELGNGVSESLDYQATASVIGGDELANVIDVSVGLGQSCALASTGQVYCWGRSKSALGIGTDEAVLTPTPIVGLSDVVDIASGLDHNCARRRSGQVVCWGFNPSGQLGDDTTAERITVRNVFGLP
jgi:alpha-tubulin suppressor-like RCC1 family protein